MDISFNMVYMYCINRITELETSKESELQRMKAELRLQLDHQKKRYEDEISTLNANYQKLKQK